MLLPKLLIIDILHFCNLSCRICDIWKTAAVEQPMDIFYVKKILFQAKRLGIEEIALSGGEPLLRKDIFDIFEYAKEIKIKYLGILTNGIIVCKYIDRLKPYLVDNIISLVVSLDSLNPYIHNYVRNSDNAWQKTVETLSLISVLKKDYPQISFNVISIIINQNLEELVSVANFIKSLGANSHQFQPLLSNNLRMNERRCNDFWVGEDRLPLLNSSIDALVAFKKENISFIKNSFDNLLLVKKYYNGSLGLFDVECFSAAKTILVSNQGKCTTCFSPYGDMRKENLEDILLGKNIAGARETVKKCSRPCLLPCFCDI